MAAPYAGMTQTGSKGLISAANSAAPWGGPFIRHPGASAQGVGGAPGRTAAPRRHRGVWWRMFHFRSLEEPMLKMVRTSPRRFIRTIFAGGLILILQHPASAIEAMECGGTEPFWDAKLSDTQVT